jgi:GNAT superfamily N-acetyltransferase
MAAPRVELLPPGAAADEALVEELARMINVAYAAGEGELWQLGDPERTTPAKTADTVRDGGMLVARLDGRVVGCGRLRPLDASSADLGLVCAVPDRWGSGVGREVVRFAEELMRSRGVAAMQLELLVPRDWVHPQKQRLREWYERLGYRVVRTAPFEEFTSSPGAAARLATPCEFLVFRKELA